MAAESIHIGRLMQLKDIQVQESLLYPEISKNPLVSIIIPNYNYGRYLKETIRSALSQDYENIEVFVADGASKDNSVEVIKQFEYDPRFHWVSEEDEGNLPAVNKAISKVKGEIFSVMMSSDTYDQGAVSSAVKVFLESHNVGYVGGKTDTVIEDNSLVESEEDFKNLEISLEEVMRFQKYPSIMSSFYRTDLFSNAGGFFHGCHSNSYLFFFLYAKFSQFKLVRVNKTWSNYRVHDHTGFDDWDSYKSLVYSEQRKEACIICINTFKDYLSMEDVKVLTQSSLWDEIERRTNKYRQIIPVVPLIYRFLSASGSLSSVINLYSSLLSRIIKRMFFIQTDTQKQKRLQDQEVLSQEIVKKDWFNSSVGDF